MSLPDEKPVFPVRNSPSASSRRTSHGWRRIVCYLIALTAAYWFLRSCFAGFSPVNKDLGNNRSAQDTSVEDFVESAKLQLSQAYDSAPVRAYCAGRMWNTAGAAVDCGIIAHDVATTRQAILNCLLSAIDRNLGFVVPSLSRLSHPAQPAALAHIFNTDLLLARLRESCPGMPLYSDRSAAEQQHADIVPYNQDNLIQKKEALCVTSSPKFTTSFSSLLQYSAPLTTVALSTLYTLANAHNLPVTPDLRTPGKSYLAIHVPLAETPEQTTYIPQLRYYLTLTSWGLFAPVVYIATPYPDSEAVRDISAYAATQPKQMRCVTLKSLLDRQRRNKNKYIQTLGEDSSPEQRVVLDTIMVENAAYFAGVDGTAFARSAAIVRAGKRGGESAACRAVINRGKWKDGWTEVVGGDEVDREPQNVLWQWP